ncbi:SPOR domain-containing protein [Haloactinopolyspora sp.]|uniref:SPOR domain-containing protein n=1 Tax=Haloactinopolyspora sp. TaxID=1966353 RepID=UPI002625BEAA|nr:SPOR domain-containing protein [Haloactinopolyspora sp.]
MNSDFVHQLLHEERAADMRAEAARAALARQSLAAAGHQRTGTKGWWRVRFALFATRRRRHAV